MGMLDKFLDIMKLNDEDDYEDDFFDDEEDDFDDFEDEKKTKKSFFKREKKYEKKYEDDDKLDFEEDDFSDNSKTTSKSSFSKNSGSAKAGNSKVTPMRQYGKKANMEVCVIKPTTVDDTREIADTLLEGSTIILNLEGLDLEVAQRIIDFTAGSTYTINGKLQKISNFIFLVTPTNVDISGDLQDLLNSSFDVPSIKTRY